MTGPELRAAVPEIPIPDGRRLQTTANFRDRLTPDRKAEILSRGLDLDALSVLTENLDKTDTAHWQEKAFLIRTVVNTALDQRDAYFEDRERLLEMVDELRAQVGVSESS